mmetsp:Transcript_4492/g.19234  ORF Transcript_4492/g.19234 Transcript_4492/m.19234 type:complete len:100 (-) Transcript_4492:550-849(-)
MDRGEVSHKSLLESLDSKGTFCDLGNVILHVSWIFMTCQRFLEDPVHAQEFSNALLWLGTGENSAEGTREAMLWTMRGESCFFISGSFAFYHTQGSISN